MKKYIFIFLCIVSLVGCSYNEVEASVELDIPNEFIPVNFSAKLHLTDKILEIKDEKTDYLIGSAILARWMQEHKKQPGGDSNQGQPDGGERPDGNSNNSGENTEGR